LKNWEFVVQREDPGEFGQVITVHDGSKLLMNRSLGKTRKFLHWLAEPTAVVHMVAPMRKSIDHTTNFKKG
jgi:hypothetical protein